MLELVAAIGLVFVLEGLLWALAPGLGRTLAATALNTPENQLRLGGLIAVALGVLIVWLVRG